VISQSPPRRSRAGFTLIELLVAISIIVILIGLTTSAVMSFRKTGPRLATKAQLQNMKIALDSQWKAVREKARKETMPLPVITVIKNWYKFQSPSVIITSDSDPRVRDKYVELKLIQAFPVSFDELANTQNIQPVGTTPVTNPIPLHDNYRTYLSVNAKTLTSANAKVITSNEVQQAVCLMMILQVGPSNSGDITPTSLGTTGARQLVLRDGTAIWGCVDAFDGRVESAVPPLPSPAPGGWKLRDQPAGPLLFTRTAGGFALTPGILSAGADKDYGLDLTANPQIFAPANPKAIDNLQVP
jgi:prepilin-type N-terminal cleavage/methylation domain-containing protein